VLTMRGSVILEDLELAWRLRNARSVCITGKFRHEIVQKAVSS
jgi:hypothetical protein